MKTLKKPDIRPPWPDDFDVALHEQDRMLNECVRPHPKPSLRSQIVTGLKLFVTLGTIGLAIWLLDQIVLGSQSP
jgi:hypothetical protein